MSARDSLPVLSGRSPVFGSASVIVVCARTKSPGASPVVESTPEGTSRARVGALCPFAQRISWAVLPPGGAAEAVAHQSVEDEVVVHLLEIPDLNLLTAGALKDAALPGRDFAQGAR